MQSERYSDRLHEASKETPKTQYSIVVRSSAIAAPLFEDEVTLDDLGYTADEWQMLPESARQNILQDWAHELTVQTLEYAITPIDKQT